MFTCNDNTSPLVFNNLFKFKLPNECILRTQFLIEPKIKTKSEQFSINFRGHH